MRPVLLVLVALLASAAPAAAHDVAPSCTPPKDPLVGQVETSPNVDHLGWIAGESYDMTPGGRRVGDFFYITGISHFSIYDVRVPERPKLVSRVNFQCRFENEDVAVDGRSLVFSDFATSQSLFVYDVRDKANPKLAAEVPVAGTHTSACALDCRYLYGSYRAASPAGPLTTGQLIDLADPSKPKVLGDWTDNGVLPSRKVHDVSEIAPGLLLSASAPIQLMDVRGNPLRPTVLARSPDAAKRYHSVEWPRQGLDRWVLADYETNATPRCEAGVGDFTVFDAGRAAETGKLEPKSTYFLQNDNDEKSSGNPAVNAGLGCSPHWFQTRPSWRDGGVVAMGAYDHGAKFLRVDPLGNISEVGHFRAPGTNASAAYWITCDIVYVVDYTRGMDIVRFRDAASDCKPGDPPPPGAELASSGPPASGAAAPRRATARLRARVRARWRAGRRFTRLRSLSVTGLPVAASVRVTCRGRRRCPVRRRTLAVRRGRAVASAALRRSRFRPGATVSVVVSRPGAVSQRVTWRVRRGRAPRRVRG
jgi:hypothetical protein